LALLALLALVFLDDDAGNTKTAGLKRKGNNVNQTGEGVGKNGVQLDLYP